MPLTAWLIMQSITILFWLWIILWGGDEVVEGWKSFFLIGWFAVHWDAEQIKLFASIALFMQALWLLAGFVCA